MLVTRQNHVGNGMPNLILHPIADMFESLKLEWGLTCGAGIIL